MQFILFENLRVGKIPKFTPFISALLKLVLMQYDFSNTTFCKLASVKFVLSKHANDKSAEGILILLKFIPEKVGLYKLINDIAAAALFYIVLLFLL